MAPLEALDAFRVSIAKFPQSPELLIAFGYLFKDIREPCAAYMQFEKACDLDPENVANVANKIMMGFETTANVEKCFSELKVKCDSIISRNFRKVIVNNLLVIY